MGILVGKFTKLKTRSNMVHKEFQSLSQDEKIKELFVHGTFVLDIRYYGYKVNLYLLFNHYYEVFYNHKLDKIEKIEELNYESSRMKFYADQIQIPVVYSTKNS